MAQHRMNRKEFNAKAANLDEAAVRKVLWTLYWRGNAQMRERIEAQLDPQQEARKRKAAEQPQDPTSVLVEVEEFAELARSGAYMAGNRRVSPKERTRWRFTYRNLMAEAKDALRADDVDTAATALELLIDLAKESRDYHLFRSEDPMQAAGVVISDAVEYLWLRLRDHHGFEGFARHAAPQLLRWEAPFGWTRCGYGSIADKETTLTTLLDRLLQLPDHWEGFAEQYLDALDAAADRDAATGKRQWRDAEHIRKERARSLEQWHQRLIEQLDGTEAEALLDRLATHPALAGPERTYLEAELAHRRGEKERARELIGQCLQHLPGHRGFLKASERFGRT